MTTAEHVAGDRWRVRRYVGGKQRSRHYRARNQREANRLAPKHLAALDAEADTHAARAGTIDHLLDEWRHIEWSALSASTVRGYEHHTRLISSRFGNRQASTITHREVTKWYAELLSAGTGTGTIQALHRVLRRVMRFGVRHWDLPKAATEAAIVPRHRTPEIDPPSQQLVRHIISSASGEFGRALTVLAHLGLRRGEVVGLRWDGVTDEAVRVVHSVLDRKGGGVIVNDTTKSGRSRWVLATDGVRLALQEQFVAQSTIGRSEFVFPNWRADTTGGTPLSPNWMSQRWAAHRRLLGATGVRLHDLRHAYATALLDAAVPVNVVQSQLGHSKASTTIDIYGHRGAAGDESARRALKDAYDA